MTKLNYNKIEIKALNLPYMNYTLIIAPNYNGIKLCFVFNGRVAKQMVTNEELKMTIYKRIRNEYNINRILKA